MAEPDADAQSAANPAPTVEKEAGTGAPPPTADEFFSAEDEPVDAATFFGDNEADATGVAQVSLARLPLPFKLMQPFLPETNEGWNEYLASTPAGRIASAFGSAFTGEGFAEAWDEGARDQMRKWGVFNAAKERHETNAASYGFGIVRPALTSLRAFNENLLMGASNAAVGGLDLLARAGEGLAHVAAQLGKEVERGGVGGAAQLGKDVGGMIELAMTRGEISPHLPHPVARGRANAVIGERGGDAAYFGLREPTQADLKGRAAAAADLPDPARAPLVADAREWAQKRMDTLVARATAGGQSDIMHFLTPEDANEYRFLRQYGADGEAVLQGHPALEGRLARDRYPPQAEKPLQAAPQGAAGAQVGTEAPEAAAPVDAPTLARQLNPDLFRVWDNLEARRRDYFRWLDELADVRDQNLEARPSPEVAAVDARISDLERKLANSGARTRGGFEADLAAARAERESLLDSQTADSPDMAQVRRRLIENDLRMRDMAVEVSAALRDAEAMLPAREAVAEAPRLLTSEAPAAPAEAVSHETKAAPVETETAGGRSLEEPKEPIVSEEQRQAIYDDIYQRLVGAGRPVEQAVAEATLWAEHIMARAERMGGALGTAREIHERETPTFRLGQARGPTPRRAARVRELAQKGEPLAVDTPEFKAWFEDSKAKKNGRPLVLYHGTTEPLDFDQFSVGEPIEIAPDDMFFRHGSGGDPRSFLGSHFAEERGVANKFAKGLYGERSNSSTGGRVIPVYLKIKKPKVTSDEQMIDEMLARPYSHRAVDEALEADGDGDLELNAERYDTDTGYRSDINRQALEIDADTEEPDFSLARQMADDYRADLQRRGFDGIRYQNDVEGGTSWVAFDPTQIKSVFNRGTFDPNDPRILFQGDRAQPTFYSALVRGIEDVKQDKASPADWSGVIDNLSQKGVKKEEVEWSGVKEWLADQKGPVTKQALLDHIEAETPEMRAAVQQGLSLFQPRRGSTTFQPGNLRPLIKLFADADASTVVHESGHVWLEELLRDAAHENAPAQVKADAETIHNWLGTRAGEAVPTRAHEKFARGFERYMMEGVAPSRALVGIFEQFKQWLVAIYQRLTSLRSPINDDVRDVFDRLLSAAPQRAVIAAEAKLREGLGDAHEAVDRGMRMGPNATAAARRIRGERNAEIINHHPEIADDLGLGGGTETPGGNGGAGPLPDGGGAPAGAVAGEGGGLPAAGAVGAGGGEFAPERPSPRPAGARESGLYAKVPKQPTRLSEFVKKNGGISNWTGELENIRAVGRRGKGISRPDGMTMERMVELAKDEGYFPELGDRLPETREFLAKLREDQHGGPQYSDYDRDEIAAYDAAMGQNAEVDRIASKYGVEVRKRMTQREFWDAVAERLSEEQAAKLAEEIDADRAALVEEAEKAAQEYIESRGEAWEPDLFYDRAEPRTLEDLENERAAEQGDGGPTGRSGGAEPPGPAGGVAGAVPADSGQGQRGAGAGRRAPEESGPATSYAPGPEPRADGPPDANIRFTEPEPELIDKAGNIRLDNLNTPEDVNAVLRAIAAEHDDFIDARRGVVTDTQRLAYADALGVSADTADKNIEALRALSVNDPFPLAARIEAARRLLIQSEKEVRAMAAKVAPGDDAALMAYAAARQRHIKIQETLSGTTAEWGRAGRAFHRLSGDKAASDAQLMTELFQSALHRTPEQLIEEAQMVMALETPGQVSNFMQAVRRPDFIRMAVEFFQGAALWSPKTWIANGAGSVLTFLTSATVHPATVGIGRIRSAVTGSQERAFAGEILPRLFGAIEGAKNGFRAARAIMRDETIMDRAHSRSEFGFDFGEDARRRDVGDRRALPGKFGTVARYSFRIMGSTDAVFKGVGYQQKLAEMAARQAITEGLEGGAREARIANLMQSPTAEMRVEAKKYADYQTFNRDLQGMSRKFQSLAGEYPIIKLAGALFIRTPINILSYSVEHSILAPLVKHARENLLGRNGAIARDEAMAKIAVGTAVSLASLAYVADGTLTAGGPKDPRERAVLMATGWRPYSVRVNGQYIPYSRLEPISTLVGVAADAAEIWHQMSEKDSRDVGMMIWGSVTQNLLNKQYMGGLSDFFEVLNNPVQYGENWTARFLTGLMPSGARHLMLAYNDPYLREASGIIDRVRANMGIGTDLEVRRDFFGEPIRRDEAWGPDFASPFTISRLVNDPVFKEMRRLEYYPSRVPKRIAGVELTGKQRDRFSMIAGREAKSRLDGLISDPGWRSIPGSARRDIIRQTFEESRETARAQVVMESMGTDNDIEALASANKEALTKAWDAE